MNLKITKAILNYKLETKGVVKKAKKYICHKTKNKNVKKWTENVD